MDKSVSVVIPSAGKREKLLAACLRSIAAQRFPSGRILVVVPPGSLLPSEAHKLAHVIQHPGPTSAALNAGIRRSPHEIVAVTNDDCVAAPGWLAEVTAPLRDGTADLCAGQSIPSRPGRVYPATYPLGHTEPRYVRFRAFRPLWNLGLNGNNFALRKEVLERVGPFNESLGPGSPLYSGEDIDMFHRVLSAGLTVCVNPRAVVFHEPLDTWHEEMRMMYSYRVGLAAYFFCHRKEAAVRDYFLRRIVVDQLRRIWRNLRQTRTERLGMEAISMLGLQVGAAKAWLYRL